VNTGHCISAFGGGGFNSSHHRQIIHVFKEQVAVGYQGQISLFKSDTGAVAFTLNPFQVQQAILFGTQSIQNACLCGFYTVSGDYMYACHGPIINKYQSTKRSIFFALKDILTLSYLW